MDNMGSYLRLIDFCITQLKAQGPSRTCNESKEEEEEGHWSRAAAARRAGLANSARIRHSGPDSSPGMRVRVLKPFSVVPSSRGSGPCLWVGNSVGNSAVVGNSDVW